MYLNLASASPPHFKASAAALTAAVLILLGCLAAGPAAGQARADAPDSAFARAPRHELYLSGTLAVAQPDYRDDFLRRLSPETYAILHAHNLAQRPEETVGLAVAYRYRVCDWLAVGGALGLAQVETTFRTVVDIPFWLRLEPGDPVLEPLIYRKRYRVTLAQAAPTVEAVALRRPWGRVGATITANLDVALLKNYSYTGDEVTYRRINRVPVFEAFALEGYPGAFAQVGRFRLDAQYRTFHRKYRDDSGWNNGLAVDPYNSPKWRLGLSYRLPHPCATARAHAEPAAGHVGAQETPQTSPPSAARTSAGRGRHEFWLGATLAVARPDFRDDYLEVLSPDGYELIHAWNLAQGPERILGVSATYRHYVFDRVALGGALGLARWDSNYPTYIRSEYWPLEDGVVVPPGPVFARRRYRVSLVQVTPAVEVAALRRAWGRAGAAAAVNFDVAVRKRSLRPGVPRERWCLEAHALEAYPGVFAEVGRVRLDAQARALNFRFRDASSYGNGRAVDPYNPAQWRLVLSYRLERPCARARAPEAG